MGLTGAGVGRKAQGCDLEIQRKTEDDIVVALVGNPNVGKSTVFNCLTGLNQHTGNWPGKTVTLAQGRYSYRGRDYILVDLPGTYSLLGHSEEELVTATFLASGQADVVLVVCDATCLERNLNLALQVMHKAENVVLCVNLLDEAEKFAIEIDMKQLELELGALTVGTAAGKGRGMERLKKKIESAVYFKKESRKSSAFIGETEENLLSEVFLKRAETIATKCVLKEGSTPPWQRKLDWLLTGRFSGFGILLLLLLAVFWLTLQGANYPSSWLQKAFDWLQGQLTLWLHWLPDYLKKPLLEGIYATTAQVVSVMLPPMTIFFVIFSLLEDFGYLPRVAFLLDRRFEKCAGCGKQALSMCMGFGCNAAGVVGCRIIDSPKERLIAVLTNALVPCNGRFPMLMALILAFFTNNDSFSNLQAAAMLTGMVLLSVFVTFAISKLLGKTVLRGEKSSFIMEMPPFRRPQILQVVVRALLDRTVYVLARAVSVAAPAGLLIWCASNITVLGAPIYQHISNFLDPFGLLLGMNGIILAAFVFGFPANELVLPLILASLTMQGSLFGTLSAAGWTWKTALCTMVFCLFHWPCSTTVLTMYKETNSLKWTIFGVILPTMVGVLLCLICNLVL